MRCTKPNPLSPSLNTLCGNAATVKCHLRLFAWCSVWMEKFTTPGHHSLSQLTVFSRRPRVEGLHGTSRMREREVTDCGLNTTKPDKYSKTIKPEPKKGGPVNGWRKFQEITHTHTLIIRTERLLCNSHTLVTSVHSLKKAH